MSTDNTASPSRGQPEAGPSTAPYRHLPKQAYGSVEYSGPVSHPTSILKVISQDDLNECFNTPANSGATLEMRYRSDEWSSVPVRGTRVSSQKLLMKVTKRRRRRDGMEVDGSAGANGPEKGSEGIFTAEVVGPITSTVRFRSMADFQYQANPDGRVLSTINALKELDYEAILEYSIPPLDERYIEPLGQEAPPDVPFRSLLDLQPTPIFSERRLPAVYSYKNPPAAVVEEEEDARTGQTRLRFVNKQRWNSVGQQLIGHGHPPGEVPKEPVKSVKAKMAKLDQRIIQKFADLLEQRPVWQRNNLLAQFTAEERRAIVTNKSYLPAMTYSIGAGPFWKSLIKYGYDPCVHPEARIYQRVYFYLQVNRTKHVITRGVSPDSESEVEEQAMSRPKSWWLEEQERRISEGLRPPIDRRQVFSCRLPPSAHCCSRAYIFDGQVLHYDKPDYQLCDVTDPLIAKYINDPENLSDTCHPRDGWYKPAALNLIKTLLRVKYVSLREKGEAPNSLCYDAVKEYEDAQKAGESEAEESSAEDRSNFVSFF